jgi:transcriptional regulator with XRE-family HTH domain
MTMFKDIWTKLSDKSYREHYALSLLKRSVAFQIKTLRKKHCGSQAVLAERSQLTQGVVSRAEDQEYGNLTFNTVGRIAAGLDMAFVGKFVPFSELAKFAKELSEDEFVHVPTFEEERIPHEIPKRHRFRNRRKVFRRPRSHRGLRRKGAVIPFPVRQNEFTGTGKRPPQRSIEGQRSAIGETK